MASEVAPEPIHIRKTIVPLIHGPERKQDSTMDCDQRILVNERPGDREPGKLLVDRNAGAPDVQNGIWRLCCHPRSAARWQCDSLCVDCLPRFSSRCSRP